MHQNKYNYCSKAKLHSHTKKSTGLLVELCSCLHEKSSKYISMWIMILKSIVERVELLQQQELCCTNVPHRDIL